MRYDGSTKPVVDLVMSKISLYENIFSCCQKVVCEDTVQVGAGRLFHAVKQRQGMCKFDHWV